MNEYLQAQHIKSDACNLHDLEIQKIFGGKYSKLLRLIRNSGFILLGTHRA